MRKVGEILQQERLKRGLSIEDIQAETKIQKKYLAAIEENNFSIIQGSTSAKGFIRNYALVLGLSPVNLLAVFRRDFTENKKGQILPRGMVEPLIENRLYWTPKLTIITLMVLLFLGIGYFFARQFIIINSAPKLTVESPTENQVFKDRVLVSGQTAVDSSVQIDGVAIGLDDKGSFSEEIVLPRGDNILTIESTNRRGKTRTVRIRVKVE